MANYFKFWGLAVEDCQILDSLSALSLMNVRIGFGTDNRLNCTCNPILRNSIREMLRIHSNDASVPYDF